MAAGKKEDKDDKAEQQVDEAAVEAKKKKKKLFLFIGLAVLLVLITAGATIFVSKMMASKHESGDEAASSESDDAAESLAAPVMYYPMKVFQVNLQVDGRQRYLQVELTLVYRDESVKKIFEDHMPEVRNGLVMLLSRQVFEEIQSAEGKEKLRAAALKSIQDIITKEQLAIAEKGKEKDDKKDKEKTKETKPQPNIEQVLFTQFVMQ